jgi:hypothetical protein
MQIQFVAQNFLSLKPVSSAYVQKWYHKFWRHENYIYTLYMDISTRVPQMLHGAYAEQCFLTSSSPHLNFIIALRFCPIN